MSCPCHDCTAIQHARSIIDTIDLIAVCNSKTPENFEVAFNISTADKHLQDAQAVLSKQHASGVDSGRGFHGDGMADATGLGPVDNALVLFKEGQASQGSATAPDHQDIDHIDSSHAHHSALVPHQDITTTKPDTPHRIQASFSPASTTVERGSALEHAKNSFGSKEDIKKRLEQFRQMSVNRFVLKTQHNASSESKSFEISIRNRAAELGILRSMTMSDNNDDDDGPAPQDRRVPTNVTIRNHKDPLKDKTRFIVCDHCRSHGLRCNESSVCRECVLREIPCVHRQCDQSPLKRDHCPRQVCFYVHADWMPSVFGVHDMEDPNWIVLPGKLREHLSAGPLSKLPPKDEAEIVRSYQGINQRQQNAMMQMTRCVENGDATWEAMSMTCPCAEIEYENLRALQADENVRRLEVIALASGNTGCD